MNPDHMPECGDYCPHGLPSDVECQWCEDEDTIRALRARLAIVEQRAEGAGTAACVMQAERDEARDRLAEVEKENRSLRETTYCAYCGERFALDDRVATAVTEHILTCPEHPMRGPERERDALRARLAEAKEKIEDKDRSIRNLSASVVLAQEILGQAAGIVQRAAQAGEGAYRAAIGELDARLFTYRQHDPAARGREE